MKMSYKKLWKLLIDKDMKKTDLRKAAGISSSSLAKLGKDENVTTKLWMSRMARANSQRQDTWNDKADSHRGICRGT